MKVQTTIAILCGALALASSAEARADQVEYVGIHPLGAASADGFCFIEVPHVHITPPPARLKVLYQVRDGRNDFVGDPVPFGYDGNRHSYYGHHTVQVDVHLDVHDPVFCYIEGPHYHEYVPAAPAEFEVKGDLYWYVGAFPQEFYIRDKGYYRRVNVIYRPMVYERPTVAVEPPVAYVGPLLAVHARAGVGGAAVVGGGGGAAVIGAGISAGVEVHIPPPPRVQVSFGIGGAIGGGGSTTVVHEHHHVHEKHHHDNGKHKGWYKGGKGGKGGKGKKGRR